jgi:hypothetical protein
MIVSMVGMNGHGRRIHCPPGPVPRFHPWSATADVAGEVAIAVLEAVMQCLVAAQANVEGAMVVRAAAQAVYTALLRLGFMENEAAEVARIVWSEAARSDSAGRGSVIGDRHWAMHHGGRRRAVVTTPRKAR